MNTKLLLLSAFLINFAVAQEQEKLELHLNTYEPSRNISRDKSYGYFEELYDEKELLEDKAAEEADKTKKEPKKELNEEAKPEAKAEVKKEVENNITNVKDLNIKYPFEFEELIDVSPEDFAKEFVIAKPAEKKEVYYFDKEGKLTEKESEGGFYREVLGENEDGITIAQDFYQDTKTAQVAPFLMVEKGDIKDFSASQNQGLLVWFDKNQKFSSAVMHDNQGKPITPQAFYKNGKLAVQADEKYIVFYYPDGKNIMAALDAKSELFIFFRGDGTLFSKASFGDNKYARFWNQSGQEIPMDENNSQSLEVLFKQVLEKFELIK